MGGNLFIDFGQPRIQRRLAIWRANRRDGAKPDCCTTRHPAARPVWSVGPRRDHDRAPQPRQVLVRPCCSAGMALFFDHLAVDDRTGRVTSAQMDGERVRTRTRQLTRREADRQPPTASGHGNKTAPLGCSPPSGNEGRPGARTKVRESPRNRQAGQSLAPVMGNRYPLLRM